MGPQPDHYAYAPMALPAPGGRDSLADTSDAFASRTVYPAPTLLAGLPIFLAEPGAGDMVFSTSRGVVATSTTDLFSHHKTGALDSGVWRAFGTIIIQMPQMSVGEPVHRLVVKLTRDSVDGSGLLKRVRLEHSYGVAEHEVLISSVSLLPNDLGTYMTQSFTSTIGKFSESTSGTIGSTTGTLVYTSLTNNKDATAPGFPLKGRYTVKLECEGMCATNSCSICIKWKDPEVIVSTIATVFHEMECADHQLVEARRQLKAQYELLIEELRTDLVSSYRGHCLGLANLDDELNLSYDEKYYHYTLYYYDRAGHLVRTVPPAGVDLSSASSMTRAGHPGHSLKTEYDYNSLGQLVRQYTPDGGETSYEYNSVGQLRFSQNAVQVTTGSYSYTKYDQLGRVTEVGQYSGSISGLADNPAAPTSNTGQVTAMAYSTPASSLPSPYGSFVQENLQNRISYAVYDEYPLFGGEEVSTYYSYDAHGNVQWVIQDIPGLTASKTDYEYDLISGNMKQVKYRDGYPDRFYHRYEYDKDNRLIGVETSRDSVLWEHDARYEYYGHGPLRRVAIGEDSVQGVDYVYTLQGWLKGINHPSLSSSDDPGGDDGTTFPKDVFGMTLGYYSGDFDRTSSPYATGSTHDLAPTHPLYNGNITSWSTNTTPLSLVGNTFHYDVLNRLREDQYNKYSSGWSTANDYNTWNTYDPNGNLTLMRRNTYESSTVKEMDKLEYHYVSGTNKLDYVHDAGAQDGSTGFTDDLRIGQAPGNYRYDNMGRVVGDNQGLLKSTWNVYNKVIDVQTNSGHSVYGYDAMGSRAMKQEYSSLGSLQKTTWYVSDASGQVMSIYEKTGDDIIQTEVPIYGSGRLGEATTGTVRSNTLVGDYLGLYDRYIDKKMYELSDHLGNVRAVISDLKEEDGGSFKAILKGYMNYYPYGQLQTGRSSNSADYRYGYNGKEMDNEAKGAGNSYDFGARMYDPRLGRWMSRDPLEDKYTGWSPFSFALNTPISAFDPNGQLVIFVNGFRGVLTLSSGDLAASGKAYTSDRKDLYSTAPYQDVSTTGDWQNYWGDIDDLFMKRIDDYNSVYVDAHSREFSSAQWRYQKGKLAGEAILKRIRDGDIILQPGETIKIVSHSQGAAEGAAIAEILMNAGYKVEVMYNLAPKQPTDIHTPLGVNRFVQYYSPIDWIAPQSTMPSSGDLRPEVRKHTGEGLLPSANTSSWYTDYLKNIIFTGGGHIVSTYHWIFNIPIRFEGSVRPRQDKGGSGGGTPAPPRDSQPTPTPGPTPGPSGSGS